MKARFLRYASVDELRSLIRENLELYRSGDFAYLSVDTARFFELTVEVDETAWLKLLTPSDASLYDPENCVLLYKSMSAISPSEARDERLWTYLTHTDLLNYSRSRWPIPSEDDVAVTHIQTHFFAKEKRQIERDNAMSRLWWMAHLCSRVTAIPLEDALRVLLFRADVRANLLERPTTSQLSNLFSAIVEMLRKSFSGEKALLERTAFRRFMREINAVGGFKLLDCLTREQLEPILTRIIVEKLEILKL